MRKILHSGGFRFEILERDEAVLSFRDISNAIAFLGPFKKDPLKMAVLRQAIAEYSSAAKPRDDDEVLNSLASLLVSGRIQILRSFRIAKGRAATEEVAQTTAGGGASRAPKNLTWIEFQAIEHLTGQPIADVNLNVRLPSAIDSSFTTDPAGMIRIEGIEPGACEIWCNLRELRLQETLVFVGMAGSSGKGSTSQSPKREPMSRRIADVEEHRVKKGETLDSLATKAGISWQALAKFNWDTDVPKEINKHLHEDVGCTKKTKDGRNYSFHDSDEPGVVYIPSKWKQTGLATGKRHVIRVRHLDPFRIVLENEEGLRIPEVDYEATLADGTVRKGKLGRSGSAIIKDPPPGPVVVVYPDLDDVAARSLAALARKSFDDRDPQELYRVLKHSPQMMDKVIKAYDKYFNDYTGNGLIEDIYQEITDPDALPAVVALLARAGVQTHEKVRYVEWEPDEES